LPLTVLNDISSSPPPKVPRTALVVITGIKRVVSESAEDAEEHMKLLDVLVEELFDEI